jgi:ABC-2 type transport system ATP-binding protein
VLAVPERPVRGPFFSVDPAVVFSDVSKTYGRQEVIAKVSLTVHAGESLGLVGSNGAGKTTLLKCLLDFTTASGGTIKIYGHDSGRIEARERLAYLPERFTPPYYLTGRDFLAYMASLYRQPLEEERLTTILSALDLDPESLRKPVRQFSKGMSQKLGLAACLLSGRELLILDEPMSGLDPKARALLKRHLMEAHAAGRTLLFSTHQLSDVEQLCDRVAILHEGRIRFVGTPQECCGNFGSADFEQAYLRCIEA